MPEHVKCLFICNLFYCGIQSIPSISEIQHDCQCCTLEMKFLATPNASSSLKFVSIYCIGEVHNDKSSPFCLWLFFALPCQTLCPQKVHLEIKVQMSDTGRHFKDLTWHRVKLQEILSAWPEYISENGQEFHFLIFVSFCDR